MRIVSAGGGSGGHVTPVLAVINELKRRNKNLEAWLVCDRGYAQLSRIIMGRSITKVGIKVITAGKLRRYHGISWWRQLLDIPTTLRNIGDVFLLGVGFLQSVVFLARVKPDVVFSKGGFVCVPVGLAARFLRIPLVIHDSDASPGLTNRILARYAVSIATGTPPEGSYPKEITHYTGIPVDKAYKPATPEVRATLKQSLGHNPDRPLVLVTGGGLGATRINNALAAHASELVKHAQVVHLTGVGKMKEVEKQVGDLKGYQVLPFAHQEMSALVRAADVVVTRAGATTLLELAASGAPTIIVPHPHLTGGHQLKNAALFEKHDAAIVVSEDDIKQESGYLVETILSVLKDPERQAELRQSIAKLAKPDAARDVAILIESAVKTRAGE